MMEKGKTKLKTVFNIYHQNSNDGNQVVDNSGREETNVIEPMVFIEHQITEDTAINGRIVFDAWTAASDTKLDNYTGASGSPIMGQNRIAANLGVRKEKKVDKNRWNFGADVGFSSEYDYRSFNGSLNASRSFAKDNFTHLHLSDQFKNHSISRKYKAIVWGIPKNQIIKGYIQRHKTNRKKRIDGCSRQKTSICIA